MLMGSVKGRRIKPRWIEAMDRTQAAEIKRHMLDAADAINRASQIIFALDKEDRAMLAAPLDARRTSWRDRFCIAFPAPAGGLYPLPRLATASSRATHHQHVT